MNTSHDPREAAHRTLKEATEAGQRCYAMAKQMHTMGLHPLACCNPEHYAVGKAHAEQCQSPGKRPLRDWKTYQDEQPTLDELATWWRSYPQSNVGLVLGHGGGLIRIDVDGEAAQNALEAASDGDLPLTWAFQSSPGNVGILYRWPKNVRCKTTTNKTGQLGTHKELRYQGYGAQTIIPPSRHPSGGIYTWLPGQSPDDCELADAPIWLVELCEATDEPVQTRQFTGEPAPSDVQAITEGCAWLRHCQDDAVTLSEPEWYGMLGVIARCTDGFRIAHAWSAPHAGYSVAKTDAKIRHALEDAGPITCLGVTKNLGAGTWCDGCQHQGNVKSPIVIGTPGYHRAWRSASIGEEPVQLKDAKGTQDGAAEKGGPHAHGEEQDDGRRAIPIMPGRIAEVVDAAIAALETLGNGHRIYQRARRLVGIARGNEPPKFLNRSKQLPVIYDIETARLSEVLSWVARFQRYDKRAKDWVDRDAPEIISKTILARQEWPFAALEGIVTSPTIRPDGSILDTPGYDADTGLYLDFNGAMFPSVPHRPTIDDARSAIGSLQEALADFPFHAPHDFSAALACTLTIAARHAIQGSVPGYGITANMPGTGKGMLADVMGVIGTGYVPSKWPQVNDDNEERKRLHTVALCGDPVLCIDNITHSVGSPTLDLALTAGTITDRLLSLNKIATAPVRFVVLLTGNNLSYRGDMTRRVVPIELYSHDEHPEERTGFRHSPLLAWVEHERPRLLAAALTVLRAFFVAGCPKQGLPEFGSFEAWSDLIRQAITWAGEPDPTLGRARIPQTADHDLASLGVLLGTWRACYQGKSPRTLPQVIGDISLNMADPQSPQNEWNALREAMGAFDMRYDGKHLNARVIGNAIRKYKGRIIGGMRLVEAGTYNHLIKWEVQTL